MTTKSQLADDRHPLVRAMAAQLTAGETDLRGRLQRIFRYVRDDVKFGFPANGDFVRASETIVLGYGQCNTKTTLFLALCRALDIPARIHFSLIKKEIQRGLFTGLEYALLPEQLSHSWVEVQVEGSWRRLDAYINNRPFYQVGRKLLRERDWTTGFSISCANGASGIEFDLDDENFVQMDAVVEDHGIWIDPADYFASGGYKNRPNALRRLAYRLRIGGINRKVDALRSHCTTGLCEG